jgi:DNA repair protein RecO (recombination protein O)
MLSQETVLQRQRVLRVEAVVLRHNNWGEADRLIWLYTLELGKIRSLAKGVRKLHSRKAGHLEPFTRVSLLLARGRDIPLITQVETIDAYLSLREDLLRTTCAAYVVELLDRFTYEEGENPGLYRLLVDTLAHLNQPIQPELVLHFYEMRLLDFIGFRPQLFVCALCSQEIKPRDQFFSAEQGGVLCPNCGLQVKEARPISMQALKYLRHFQRSNFTQAMRARFSVALNHEIETIMQYYLTYLLERSLNTPQFLRRIRRQLSDSIQDESKLDSSNLDSSSLDDSSKEDRGV